MTGGGLRADTGNFNRFLTSLGLLLLAASLVIPYFYFGNTETLEIPAADLRRMTDIGSAALTQRQEAIASLQPWVLGGSGFLAILGTVLVIAGGIRLKSAQESDEEEAQLRKDRARLEMKSLSPEERAEKVVEKAREETPPAPESPSRPLGTRQPQPSPPAPKRRTQGQPSDRIRSMGERQKAVARIEKRIEEVFEASSTSDHRLKLQVKVSSAVDAVTLDGVFEANDDGPPDVVLKTRVAFNPEFIPRTARMTADELIAQLVRYQAMTHHTADGWLVAVVPAEIEEETTVTRLKTAAAALDAALATFGKATVVREASIDELPELFRAHFGHTYLL